MVLQPGTSILLCVVLASLYVSSLYMGNVLFGRSLGSRDSLAVVKRRFVGVTITCMLAPAIVEAANKAAQPDRDPGANLWISLGLRYDRWVAAILYPLVLTAILFFGPLLMWALNLARRSPVATVLEDESQWKRWGQEAAALGSDILVWRNLVVAPVTEEFVFRACIGELLRLGGFSVKSVVLICPVFFAVAHLHHFWDLVYYQRQPVQMAVLSLVLQMTYTTLFGWYAAFLFVRTGHLMAPIVAHVFCNIMGFPDIGALPRHPNRRVLLIAFVAGLVAFVFAVGGSRAPTWLFGHTHFRPD